MHSATAMKAAARKRPLPGMAAWAVAGRRLRIGEGGEHRRVLFQGIWFWTDGFIMLRADDDLFPLPYVPISADALASPEWAAPRDKLIRWSEHRIAYLETPARYSTADQTTRVQERFVDLVESSFPGAEWRGTGNNRHSFHVIHERVLVAIVMPLMPSEGEY